jgi:PilZ domain
MAFILIKNSSDVPVMAFIVLIAERKRLFPARVCRTDQLAKCCRAREVERTRIAQRLRGMSKTLPPSPLMHLAALPAANSAERRSNRRYPITLRLQYKILNKGRVERLGIGRTVNISTGGVLFEANELLPTTCQIELALHWPFLLQGSCGLKLVMRGRVVWSDDKAIAMEAEFHEFRTAARSLFVVAGS